MRYMEDFVREICNEENITLETFCDSYCIKLSKNNNVTFIFDNIFENNSSAVYKILKDKSAVFELLSKHNIPSAEHYYYYSPSSINETTLKSIQNLLKKHKMLVIKPNEGTNGTNVLIVKNINEFINLSNQIFKNSKSLTVSPFYDIKHEYRVVMLNGKIKLIFDKIRPFVIGNGKDTIETLTKNTYKNQIKIDKDIKLNYIPKLNEKITLSWRHNLSFGAIPKIVTNAETIQKITDIALKSYNLLHFKFASVDIIETADEKYQVLEINGSVCMGKFASFSKENYNLAKDIYKQAILDNLK